MPREEFWETIDAARAAAMFHRSRLPAALREELEGRDEEEVLDFIRHFHECRIEAFRWELWAAAWVAGGGAAEEDFSDFRDWLITLGREAFEDVLHDPQRMLDHADPAELSDPFDAEVGKAAVDVYHELTGGGEIPPGTLRPHPREPAGRPFKPEDLPRRYPRLWRAYNE